VNPSPNRGGQVSATVVCGRGTDVRAEMSGRRSKHWLCVAGPCSIRRRSTLATCHATDHGAPAIYNSTYVTVVEPEDRARGGGEGGLGAVPPPRCKGAEPPLEVWGSKPPEAGVLMSSV